MEITGEITYILEKESGEGRNGTWQKQNVIIKTEGEYPKSIQVTVSEKCFEFLDKKKVGDSMTASINIESREWNEKWYTDVKAWKIV